MLNINHNKVEQFYDFLDEGALIIYEKAKISYLDSLLLTLDFLLLHDEKLNDLDESILDSLENLYEKIENITFNKEEIRKAYQLALLKAFKHQNFHLSEITPDSIGMLFAYFVDLFFQKQNDINLLDPNVGSGNLLFAMMNNSNRSFQKIYGIDQNPTYLQVALRLANVLEYSVEFFNQNNLTRLMVSPVDLIISDLPIDEEKDATLDLITVKNKIHYKPYLMIEQMMSYGKEGSYFFYLIPNDFFIKPHNEIMKKIILKSCHIEAIIELPLDMFKEKKYQKSILILRKRSPKLTVNQEILMLRFPSFKEKEKVKIAMDKINQWFLNRTI